MAPSLAPRSVSICNRAVSSSAWKAKSAISACAAPRSIPTALPGGVPSLDTETTFRSDFYSALTGRAGFAFGDALIYAKGGLAMLNARASTVDSFIAPPGNTGC